MADLRHVPCGACGSQDSELVGAPRVSEGARALITQYQAISVFRCLRCGFYYTDPMPFWDDADLQALYDGEYFGEESPWWHRARTDTDPRRRLDAIAREVQHDTPRLLDIGCGQGYVLEHALGRGWAVWGLEPSAAWAQRTASRLGVEIWAERVERADVPRASCDIVFSDSVIEHLAEPIKLMKLAGQALKPAGIAYLVTPNADALVNRLRGLLLRFAGSSRALYIEPLSPPYHVVGFNARSLKVLADRTGFEVRHIWVGHGRDEWRKDRHWNSSKLKSLELWPCLALGEAFGRGTTIDALLVRR